MSGMVGIFQSLRVRFVITVALIEIIMVVALVWGSMTTLRETHEERLEETARNLAQLFADTSAPYLVAVDYAGLDQYAQRVLKQREVAYVIVLDEDGRRVAHAGNLVAGLPPPDPSLHAVDDGVYDIAQPVVLNGKLRGQVRIGFSLDRLRQALALERDRSVVIAVVGVILSAAIALVIGFGLTRRLGDLVHGIGDILRGKYEPLPVGGPTEVQRLTVGYNTMLETIRARLDELKMSEERFRSLVDSSPDCVLLLDLDLRVVHLSKAGLGMFVITRAEELVNRPFIDLFPPASRDWIRTGLAGAREGNVMSATLMAYSQDAREKWVDAVLAPVRNANGAIVSLIGTLRDVTETKAQAAALEHMTLHDLLTDLPNRALFISRLDERVTASQADDTPLAVVVLDLDRFKEVNDTLGHHIGDQMLQQVAFRLRQAMRPNDVIARLGGDEFAVFMPKATEAEALSYAQKFIRVLEQPIPLAELDIPIATSIGVAMFPAHGRSAAVLLQRADVAMYYAKRQRSGFAVYKPEIDPNSLRRLTMVGELRHAIDNNELFLQFQPKIEVRTGQCCGVEALVRWQHPQHGVMPPMEFIPLSEETGLIRPMLRWVLDAALHSWSIWKNRGFRITVAVNISVRNLLDPKLEEMIAAQIKRWEIPPELLQLEITESDIMSDPTRALRVLRALDETGIRLSIDDFGTGYSSLAYLKQLPVDEIKIDRSFVLDMQKDENDAMIVDATIDLAHKLGLTVVAEGVENAEVLGILNKLHCDVAQGYHISRPVDHNALLDWLSTQPVCEGKRVPQT